MKILIIDNYDSFSYNLYHMVEANLPAGALLEIRRNDALEVEEAGEYDKIIISPGPGLPDQAGITKEIIGKYFRTKSILGVCLGLQAIVEVFGGRLHNLGQVLHGVAVETRVVASDDYLFKGCPPVLATARYHSWVAHRGTFPACLEVTALDHDRQVMALRHRRYDVHAVQFHPESILTPQGERILRNWIEGPCLVAEQPASLVEVHPLDPL